MVFAPVDVRNFVQTGLMIHSYPVHTGQDKLRRYLADASPLSLALHLATQREAVGRARVGLAGPADNIEVENCTGIHRSIYLSIPLSRDTSLSWTMKAESSLPSI